MRASDVSPFPSTSLFPSTSPTTRSAFRRATNTLLSRLRSRKHHPPHPLKLDPRYSRTTGDRSISLSGDFIIGSTHSITSVVQAVRQIEFGSSALLRVSAALEPVHISPFILIDHVGPTIARAESTDYPRCGMQMLLYVMRGCVAHRNSALQDEVHVRDGQALLLHAGRGVAVREEAETGPLETLTVWIHLPRERRETMPETMYWQQLPEYVVGDAEGEERGRVCIVLGDQVPVENAKCVRPMGNVEGMQKVKAGVYDVCVKEGASLRLRIRNPRVLMYVREGGVKVGGRVVKKGALAVLHGPGEGCMIIECEGEGNCSCVVLEGETVNDRVEWTPAGFVAGSAREMRRCVKRHAKGEMGSIAEF